MTTDESRVNRRVVRAVLALLIAAALGGTYLIVEANRSPAPAHDTTSAFQH